MICTCIKKQGGYPSTPQALEPPARWRPGPAARWSAGGAAAGAVHCVLRTGPRARERHAARPAVLTSRRKFNIWRQRVPLTRLERYRPCSPASRSSTSCTLPIGTAAEWRAPRVRVHDNADGLRQLLAPPPQAATWRVKPPLQRDPTSAVSSRHGIERGVAAATVGQQG